MEILRKIEDEAIDRLRASGQVVYHSAAENLATAIHYGLIQFESAKAERYCVEQSMAAGRIITEGLGVAPEFMVPTPAQVYHELAVAV